MDQAEAAADAGLDLLQVRERDLDGGVLVDLLHKILRRVEGSTLRVVVNDRIDAALASGIHGVHLRGDSPRAKDVRRLVGPSVLLGRSVHDVGEAREAGPVDYVLVGTVFPSASKAAGAPTCGLAGVAEVAAGSPVPVLAIGGLRADQWPALRQTGARGLAGIGLFVPAGWSTVPDLRTHYRALRTAVDTVEVVP